MEWTLRIPSLEANLEIKPFFDEQSTPYYWEGVSAVEGIMAGEKVFGKASVRMTGYEIGSKGKSFLKLFSNAFDFFRRYAR